MDSQTEEDLILDSGEELLFDWDGYVESAYYALAAVDAIDSAVMEDKNIVKKIQNKALEIINKSLFQMLKQVDGQIDKEKTEKKKK